MYISSGNESATTPLRPSRLDSNVQQASGESSSRYDPFADPYHREEGGHHTREGTGYSTVVLVDSPQASNAPAADPFNNEAETAAHWGHSGAGLSNLGLVSPPGNRLLSPKQLERGGTWWDRLRYGSDKHGVLPSHAIQITYTTLSNRSTSNHAMSSPEVAAPAVIEPTVAPAAELTTSAPADVVAETPAATVDQPTTEAAETDAAAPASYPDTEQQTVRTPSEHGTEPTAEAPGGPSQTDQTARRSLLLLPLSPAGEGRRLA
ncbi:uncharacterized protein PGTG_05339 [Puccinia graminis f. sp. tritici CRL 75-36-700-3]|uniref:Uncharacterized protein n=1 Tax=Puccinia graminis f. sp. tritici (strain CRL 75-36-700-3 / race SCCL) TaxID=418459 RepID=E3K748_PUCGT|nr:uncharacterized protein PGTG_05339 [Puccinia graminis f. sp. tritici CRL 75-36-700-3]EFP80114.2 hypothetical protein PGTG_05339 [Puccinia graminis f. sp. tritici CRL 75-36-700-3]